MTQFQLDGKERLFNLGWMVGKDESILMAGRDDLILAEQLGKMA